MKYGEWGEKLRTANETQIFKWTGCIPNCDRYEYGFDPKTLNHKPAEVGSMQFWFAFNTGRREMREQAR